MQHPSLCDSCPPPFPHLLLHYHGHHGVAASLGTCSKTTITSPSPSPAPTEANPPPLLGADQLSKARRHSPSTNDDLPGGTLAHTCLDDISEVHLLDAFRLYTGSLDRVFDGDNAEFGGFEGSEGAVDRTDGRPGRGEDVDVLEG